MEINIVGKHFEITEGVRDYVQDRIGRLTKYFDGIKRVEIILSAEGDRKLAELVMSLVRGKVQIAHASANTIYAAIDEAHDKAEKQLTRFKEKIRDRRSAEHLPPPESVE